MIYFREIQLKTWLFLAALCSPVVAHAFGNDSEWTSGYGMGVAEAIITAGPGNHIMVSCTEDSGNIVGSGIRFTLVGVATEADKIVLTFDGGKPVAYSVEGGSIISKSRVDASQFEDVLDLFRTRKSVHVLFMEGAATTFSLKGAAKAIGECPSDYSKT